MNRHIDTRQSRDGDAGRGGPVLLCEECFTLVASSTSLATGHVPAISSPCEGCGTMKPRKDLYLVSISSEEAATFQRARAAARESL